MAIDWSQLYRKYKGQWVALLDDETTVIGSGKTAKLAQEKAKKKGYEKPILTRVPTNLTSYVG